MSLEKDLREAVSDLAFGDEAAAEVLYIFVRNMNDEEKVQSASSMILNLGKALVEFEDSQDDGQEPETDVNGN
jgi:hypothetical protein